MSQISNKILSNVDHIKDHKIWISEANFALSHITNDLENLSKNANVLEVGSGSGILLSHLVQKYGELNFIGLEPYAGEFIILKQFHNALKSINKHLVVSSYENFQSNQKFDYIFLINVFEHLDNWKDFLIFIEDNLSENGKCLILCPNYGFPYETHFNIPIIINKDITYKIFKRNILYQENIRNAHGLWDSLNFITYNKLVRESKVNKSLQLKVADDVLFRMIERSIYDKQFKKRHKLMSSIAYFFYKCGLLGIFKLRFMRYVDPYMKIYFYKKINKPK